MKRLILDGSEEASSRRVRIWGYLRLSVSGMRCKEEWRTDVGSDAFRFVDGEEDVSQGLEFVYPFDETTFFVQRCHRVSLDICVSQWIDFGGVDDGCLQSWRLLDPVSRFNDRLIMVLNSMSR